jgi:putative membrane protein
MYYTIKQVLGDPETRGTLLIPLGILLLIYPLSIIADQFDMPGAVFGVTSALIGFYLLSRGLALGKRLDTLFDRVREGLYGGRVSLVTYLVAGLLLVIGGFTGVRTVTDLQAQADSALDVIEVIGALVYGSLQWFAAAGVTSSLGRVVDSYIDGEFEWRHLNAPVYVLAIAFILHGVSSYVLAFGDLSYLAFTLTGATLLGLASTFAFALAESRLGSRVNPT